MRGPRFVLPCFLAAFLPRGWWCRKSESYSSYALRSADVWAVRTNIVSCSDVTIALLAQSRASRVTGLTTSFVAQSLTADARGNADGSPLGATLFRYDPFGQRTLTVEDRDRNGQIDWNGPDGIASNDVRYVLVDGDWWRETSAWQTRADGSSALSRVSATRTRLTGLGSADGSGGVLVAETQTLDARGHATARRTR